MSNSKKVCSGDSEGRLSKSLPLLPCDIITYDILTRLPINSLMRFKSVCKSWSTLINNDAKFINLHSCRQTNSNRGFIWLSKSYTAGYSEDDDDDDSEDDDNYQDYKPYDTKFNGIVFFDIDKKERKVLNFKPESGLFYAKSLFIQDSLNVLVLLTRQHTNFRSYHVYNPFTGYSYKLPVGNAFVQGDNDNLYSYLVYDSVIEKYKVLCLRLNLPPTSLTSNQYSLKIITLGTTNDSWRDVDFPKMHPYLDDFTQVFANGSYNWLDSENEVLSIDVCNKVFHTIKYPKGSTISSRFETKGSSKLFEIKGSLGFLDYTDNSVEVHIAESFRSGKSVAYKGKLKLWILKEGGEKKKNEHQIEWIRMYSIVDMFQNINLPRTFIHSYSSIVIVAVVMHPTPLIIFGVSTEEFGEDGEVDDYYSYNVKLKKLDSIFKTYAHNKWHVGSLTRL